jgi:curved DNA-binding protein CbpA
LEGARHAAEIEDVAKAVLPEQSIVEQSHLNGSIGAIKLSPVESFVLSRIESATSADDVCAMTGLPDDEARRAVCTLLAAGLISRVRSQGDDEGERKDNGNNEAGESAEKLREEVSRKLHFFSSADFYEVLGVTSRATSGEIKAAYYQLAKKFHPDKYRQPEHKELRAKLEALFAKITQAYETLSDGAARGAYDDKTKNSAGLNQSTVLPMDPRPAADVTESEPISIASAHSDEAAGTGSAQSMPATQAAEFYYQKGRSRYDQKDYYAAVQLLREAVKLDPHKPQYHFHLGIALTQNPRTRKEGESHLIKAAELDPFSAQIRVRLGILYKEAGLPKRAEAYFREALTIDPENRAARKELGVEGKKDDTSFWKADIGTIAKKIFKK